MSGHIFLFQETVNGTLQYVSNSTLKPVEVSKVSRFSPSPFHFHQVFTFTSIISAVDPVAVLAIFSEVTTGHRLLLLFPGRGESGPLLHGLRRIADQRWRRCGRSRNYMLKPPPSGSLQNDEQLCRDHVCRGDGHPHQLPHGTP